MKFKVGDKVRVKLNNKVMGGKYAGVIGFMFHINKGVEYPYVVQFDGKDRRIFCARELELADA